MADELLDLVDKDDNVIGTVWKSEAHKNPILIHREIAVAVFNNNKQVLLQQRSAKKTNDPLAWKITVAGHVGAGEDPKLAAERELFEELGFKTKIKFYNKVFISQKEYDESRFFYVYYAIVDFDPKIIIDPIEVADAKWVEIDGLKEFAKNNKFNIAGWSNKTIIEIAKMLKII